MNFIFSRKISFFGWLGWWIKYKPYLRNKATWLKTIWLKLCSIWLEVSKTALTNRRSSKHWVPLFQGSRNAAFCSTGSSAYESKMPVLYPDILGNQYIIKQKAYPKKLERLTTSTTSTTTKPAKLGSDFFATTWTATAPPILWHKQKILSNTSYFWYRTFNTKHAGD